jgi:hypothetical protein
MRSAMFTILVSFGTACTSLRAEVIYSGFSPDDAYSTSASRSATTPNRGNPPADGDLGAHFRVPANSDYALDSIELALRFDAGVNALDIWIMRSVINVNPLDGGQPRDEPDDQGVLEHFLITNSVLPGIGNIVFLESQARPILAADSLYWVVISVPEPDSEIAWWAAHESLIPNPVWLAERFDLEPWIVRFSLEGPGRAFRVTATPVPEPTCFSLLSKRAIAKKLEISRTSVRRLLN